MGRLDGKIAIITGAASGMGRADAVAFVKEGAKVVVGDLNEEGIRTLVEELGEENAAGLKFDITKQEDWDAALALAHEKFGTVEVLVNNAGIFPTAPLDMMSIENFSNTLNVNVISYFRGIKTVIDDMRKLGKGSIINLSSIAGFKTGPATSAYATSKFAVRGLTQALGSELASENIRVNAIHPGIIKTPMVVDTTDNEAVSGAMLAAIPMHRWGKPEELANVAVFLASDESSYVAGASFVADGGFIA